MLYAGHVVSEEMLKSVVQKSALLGGVQSRKLMYFIHTSQHTSLDIVLGPRTSARTVAG